MNIYPKSGDLFYSFIACSLYLFDDTNVVRQNIRSKYKIMALWGKLLPLIKKNIN